jgi:hypothetical protein
MLLPGGKKGKMRREKEKKLEKGEAYMGEGAGGSHE